MSSVLTRVVPEVCLVLLRLLLPLVLLALQHFNCLHEYGRIISPLRLREPLPAVAVVLLRVVVNFRLKR